MNGWAAQQQRTVWRQKLAAAVCAAVVMTLVYGAAAMRAAACDVKPIAEEWINPNTAAAASLMRLPGIGRVRAMEIIKMRPYESAAQMDRVRGIGPRTVEKIAPYLSFDNKKKETTDSADCTD